MSDTVSAIAATDTAKPTGVRWKIFLLMLFLISINYIDRASLSVAMPLISKEFDVDPALQGLILSSFFWTYALMQVPGGMLADRFKPRIVIASRGSSPASRGATCPVNRASNHSRPPLHATYRCRKPAVSPARTVRELASSSRSVNSQARSGTGRAPRACCWPVPGSRTLSPPSTRPSAPPAAGPPPCSTCSAPGRW